MQVAELEHWFNFQWSFLQDDTMKNVSGGRFVNFSVKVCEEYKEDFKKYFIAAYSINQSLLVRRQFIDFGEFKVTLHNFFLILYPITPEHSKYDATICLQQYHAYQEKEKLRVSQGQLHTLQETLNAMSQTIAPQFAYSPAREMSEEAYSEVSSPPQINNVTVLSPPSQESDSSESTESFEFSDDADSSSVYTPRSHTVHHLHTGAKRLVKKIEQKKPEYALELKVSYPIRHYRAIPNPMGMAKNEASLNRLLDTKFTINAQRPFSKQGILELLQNVPDMYVFRYFYSACYNTAKRHGFLDECLAIVEKNGRTLPPRENPAIKVYTQEECKKIAEKYTDLTELNYFHPNMIAYAREQQWLDVIHYAVEKQKEKLFTKTLREWMEIAKTYPSRSALNNRNRRLYLLLRDCRLLDSCISKKYRTKKKP